jgi:aminoglycoside phosphotransferase (APT) family kinase protein
MKSSQYGSRLKREFGIPDVRQICAEHGIKVHEIRSVTGSFNKKMYLINDEFLLRVSAASMALEQENFSRVAALDHVPKIIHAGVFEHAAGPVYYTLLTLLPGDDLVNVYGVTSVLEQIQLGRDVAVFLDDLHAFTGTHYDIGLYVPVIPSFSGTWRAGHQAYWDILHQGTTALQLQADSHQVFAQAFRYLQASVEALDYQTGPKLLHNGFHPRNVLLDQGKFAGVIDWECSQYGEADFELCHLIHWCLYPPEAEMKFQPFLRSLLQSTPKCAQVPHLAQRLTIYQIEHEIQQIIWNSTQAESERVPRLVRWIAGDVDRLFREIL